ncbi:MAG TPA: hypothetical protein VF221_04335 [Chloroflexota bacterium]
MGPDQIGAEFDDTEEDETADPKRVYDTLDDTEGVVRILAGAADTLTIWVDGDDVTFAASVDGRKRHMVVPRTALVEAFQTVGLIERVTGD